MCVHWALAKGSAPSTPTQRYGALRRFRPAADAAGVGSRAGRIMTGGPAIREHEAAGERCHPAVRLVKTRGARLLH